MSTPSPAPSSTPPDNDRLNKILAAFLQTDLTLVQVAEQHQMTVLQLLEWSRQPKVREVLQAVFSLARTRARIVAAESRLTGLRRLDSIAEFSRHEETARRAAMGLLNASAQRRRRRVPPTSPREVGAPVLSGTPLRGLRSSSHQPESTGGPPASPTHRSVLPTSPASPTPAIRKPSNNTPGVQVSQPAARGIPTPASSIAHSAGTIPSSLASPTSPGPGGVRNSANAPPPLLPRAESPGPARTHTQNGVGAEGPAR